MIFGSGFDFIKVIKLEQGVYLTEMSIYYMALNLHEFNGEFTLLQLPGTNQYRATS